MPVRAWAKEADVVTADIKALARRLREMSKSTGHHRQDRETWGAAAYRIESLEVTLRAVIKAGRAYMEYHTEKFYAGRAVPIGITPFLDEAQAILDGFQPTKES
jgi:hypothetical protein